MSVVTAIGTVVKSKKFLFALGVVGVGLTAVTAVTGTIAAQDHIQKEKEKRAAADNADILSGKYGDPDPAQMVCSEDYELTKLEVVKVVWKDYVLMLTAGALTIVVFTRLFNKFSTENAALHAGLSAAEATVQKLQDNMIKSIGEKKANDIAIKSKNEVLEKNPPVESKTDPKILDGVDPDDIINVCMYIDGRTFKSTKLIMQKAIEAMNLNLRTYGHTCLNDFYENVGQETTEVGDIIIWTSKSLNDGTIDINWDPNWCGAYTDQSGKSWTYIRFNKDFDDDLDGRKTAFAY